MFPEESGLQGLGLERAKELVTVAETIADAVTGVVLVQVRHMHAHSRVHDAWFCGAHTWIHVSTQESTAENYDVPNR